MQMHIEYFSNSCEDLNDKYLSILSDVRLQEKFWFEGNRSTTSCIDFIELLLSDLKHLFTTSEYRHYETYDAMILLKDLFQLTKSYYTNIETASRFSNKKKLLNDPSWIEIQNLAKKTEQELKKFINHLRKNGDHKDDN